MDLLKNEPEIRIVSQPAHLAEQRINDLLGVYSPLIWNIAPAGDVVMVTCVLVHERALRRQQLSVPQLQMGRPNGR